MKPPGKRFGLRTLLIVVTIAAIAAAFYGNRVYRAHKQEVAIKAIKKAGGKFIINKSKDVERVLFRDAGFGDDQLVEMLPHLANLFALKEVDFVRNSLSDESIQSLQRLRQIERLYLFETTITPEAIQKLDTLLPDRVIVSTEEPEPIATSMAGMVVYSHALVAIDWTPDGQFLATGSGDEKFASGILRSRNPSLNGRRTKTGRLRLPILQMEKRSQRVAATI